MTNWRIVQGSQSEKPLEIDTASSRTTVYLRRNIHTVEIPSHNEDTPPSTMWEYEERTMTKEEYAVYTKELTGYIDVDTCSIEELKANIRNKISVLCEQTIVAGVDVGEEHFAMTQNDQINISALYTSVMKGTPYVPYHADGKLCRMYSAEEFTQIANAVESWKTYNTTLCNYLNVYIESCATKAELLDITYSVDCLPTEIREKFDNLMTVIMGA